MTQTMQDTDAPQGADTPEIDPGFEAMLSYLKHVRGFDFTGYKRGSLMRRVQTRMQTVGMDQYAAYTDYLEVHPDEFAHLFDAILINVTAFFRDTAAWEHLRDAALPRLLSQKTPGNPIRVWSAGCASGEEAYTLAIVLAEMLGLEAFRERVKIYATDIDQDALNQARQAAYTPREVAGVPAELRDKYFDLVSGNYVVHRDLRRAVIFGRHDLIQDASISRIDLLTCRNALMYFNAEVQARVLARLHFALDDGGILFLGKAEMLFTHANLFIPQDLRHRIFTKVPKVSLRERLQLMAQAGTDQEVAKVTNHVRMREKAFESGPVAQFVVGADGLLALVNDRARALFGLTESDLGRPLRDLEMSYRPLDLRSMIDRAYSERRPIIHPEIDWPGPGGAQRHFEVQVVPVEEGDVLLGASVTFDDTTAVRQLQDALQETNRELETTSEELQSTVEELETTNEELQSTVEELETTNEELQSTNEELETMNEELQSTNEELQTVNEETRLRGEELSRANAYLASILSSLRAGVVVLDQALTVQVWNQRSEDLWGLHADEVQDKQFLILDIGLPVDRLGQTLRDCLNGKATRDGQTLVARNRQTLVARNRRGRDFLCRVTCTPLAAADGGPQGVILFMEEADAAPPATAMAAAQDGREAETAP